MQTITKLSKYITNEWKITLLKIMKAKYTGLSNFENKWRLKLKAKGNVHKYNALIGKIVLWMNID